METEVSEVEGFGDGSIATSDNGDSESLVEIPITGSTVRYPLSIKFHFSFHSQFLVFISGCKYHSFCFIRFSSHGAHTEVIFANFCHCIDTILDDRRSCSLSVCLEILHDFSSWSG